MSFMIIDPYRRGDGVKVEFLYGGALTSGPVGTLSWTGIPFGEPSPDRELLLVWIATRSSSGLSVLSRTIAGAAADVHDERSDGHSVGVTDYYQVLGVASVRDASLSTSGDVTFVFGSGATMRAALYRVTGLVSRVASATQYDRTNGTGNVATSIPALPGGATFAVFYTMANLPAVTVTHSGVPIDVNSSLNPVTISQGHTTSNSASTISLSATSVGPGSDKHAQRILAASFK